VYLKKIFRGRSPRTPRGEGGERKGREGGDKGKEEKGGRERRKEGKGIRVGREGIGPPQCLTQIDAPGSVYIMPEFFANWVNSVLKLIVIKLYSDSECSSHLAESVHLHAVC
jgi:hypothetical protein